MKYYIIYFVIGELSVINGSMDVYAKSSDEAVEKSRKILLKKGYIVEGIIVKKILKFSEK